MERNFGITLAASYLILACFVEAQLGSLDVTKYGAKPDGGADMSQALLSAWKEACASTTPSTIEIPAGTFLLKQAKLEGPCKAPIELQVKGTVSAPADTSHFKEGEWVTVQYVDRFTLSGEGTFDGQGARAWTENDCKQTGACSKLPNVRYFLKSHILDILHSSGTVKFQNVGWESLYDLLGFEGPARCPTFNFSFNFLTNSTIRDITSKDSKLFHVNVLGCKNLTFHHITITAPENSLNTDGIHVARSKGVNITDSTIKTGDDCVSIGDGTEQVRITRVTCGPPGHGISVGSLGKNPNEEPVVGIYVTNCTLIGTTNGVRVKTWPASQDGVVTDIHVEDIVVQNVSNPVIIDQEYCPYNKCTLEMPSRVKISKIRYNNIRGTSATPEVVKLVCSKGFPCDGVEVGEIDLSYSGNQGPATTNCANVQPKFTGKQNPPVCANAARTS